MPSAKVLSGESLANAIYQITDKLEEQFVEEFIFQTRKLSRSKGLQKLLDQIEGGYFQSASSIPATLSLIKVDTSLLDSIVRKAMGSAGRITNEKVGLNISFNVRNPTIIESARNMSIELSTNLSQTSQKILDKVIGDALEGLVTRREAVKIIESRVGLLPAHSDAVDRYYDTLIESGSTKAMAKKLSGEYADRLLTYRANTIARTEIARATGIGQTEFWRQAIAEGAFPSDTKRVWTTSYDELVCEICAPMNNVEVGILEPWLTPNGFVDYPSAIHPNCRCSQGIALSRAQKRMFVGKSDAEQFEHYVLSKYNPNHDELGRFATSPDAMARRASTTSRKKQIQLGNAQRTPQDWNNTRYNVVPIIAEDLRGFEDVLNNEPTAENKKVAKRGPKGTKVGADGLPIMLSEKVANKKYGSTLDDVMQYIADNHDMDVSMYEREPEYENIDRRVLQGCAQFFDDAKSSGIDVGEQISEIIFTNNNSSSYIGAYWPHDAHIEIFTDKVHDMKYTMAQEYFGSDPSLVASAFGQTLGKKYNKKQILDGALDSAIGYSIMAHESAHALDYKETNLTTKATTKLRALLKQNFEKKLADPSNISMFTPDEIKKYRKEPLEALNRFGADGYNIKYEDGTVWVQQSAYSEGKQISGMNSASSNYAMLRGKHTVVSDYSTKNNRELFAENFSAWFLLSKAKTKLALDYYNRNIGSVEYTVAVSDGIMKQDKYGIFDSIDIFSINHPVGIFILSQTDSSEIEVSKYNLNHDEIGRFSSGSAGGRRVSQAPNGKVKSSIARAIIEANESLKKAGLTIRTIKVGEPNSKLSKQLENSVQKSSEKISKKLFGSGDQEQWFISAYNLMMSSVRIDGSVKIRNSEGTFVVVVEKGKSIVGALRYDPNKLKPEFKNSEVGEIPYAGSFRVAKGVGTAMFGEALKIAVKNGTGSIKIQALNTARTFWEKAGFKIVGKGELNEDSTYNMEMDSATAKSIVKEILP